MVSTTTCSIRAPNLPLTFHPAIFPRIRNKCSYKKVLSQNWPLMERDPIKKRESETFPVKSVKALPWKKWRKNMPSEKKWKCFLSEKVKVFSSEKVKVFSSDWESPDLRLHHQFAKEKTVIGFSSKQKRIHFKYNIKHVVICVQLIFGWWSVKKKAATKLHQVHIQRQSLPV